MRGVGSAACLALGIAGALAGTGAAQAETDSFFRNLLGGGGDKGSAIEEKPATGGPRLYDPDEVYCPNVSVRDGAAAHQAYAGAAGDGSRLRHQITFARFSRECGLRADGAVTVKVGVEVRGLLGPAGASGSFEAPMTISVKVGDKVLDSRTRRVHVVVPAGAAQGTASVVEDGLIVPAAGAHGFDIEVAMAGAAAKPKAPMVASKRGKPVRTEASADGGAPAAGQ